MESELEEKKDRWCQGCREVKPSVEEGGKALVRCKGCESVRYCGKVSSSSLEERKQIGGDLRPKEKRADFVTISRNAKLKAGIRVVIKAIVKFSRLLE